MNSPLFLASLLLTLPAALVAQPTVPPLVAVPEPTSPAAAGPARYPFQNPDLPLEQRVDNLVSLLTPAEKLACWSASPSVPRLGIRGGLSQLEGLHGVSQGGGGHWGGRGGRPTTTTVFPQSVGLGETWDAPALRQAGAIEAHEIRFLYQSPSYRRGGLVIRAPNVDLARDPRWGRSEESYGEDAFLTGTLGVAFIRGLQGDDPNRWEVAALMKHFLANSNEDTRTSSSSDFDERLLREYYSVPFRMGVIQGGSRAFMTSYNAINGVPATMFPFVKDVAVREWGQDGIVVTDAGALGFAVTAHHYEKDNAHAVADAVKSGGVTEFLDNARIYGPGFTDALAQGLLTQADIDQTIRGNFRVMIRLGLLDPPERDPYRSIGANGETAPWLSERTRAFVRQLTDESVVLLKNQDHFLPLDKSRVRSIAVVGQFSNVVVEDWYGGTPPNPVTPLQGITDQAGPGVKINAAVGGDDAVRAAAASDVAIVCVGNHPDGGFDQPKWGKVDLPSYGREAADRQSIDLEDEALVKKIYAANPRTIVVLISSFPYAINWSQQNVPAIVHLTHSSEELGTALADVLFGGYNPAGRLVVTWPKSLDQLPPLLDYNLRDGRTYMYFKGEPLYPFGYGLSYTTFGYTNLTLSDHTFKPDGTVKVGVDVQNTGPRAGDEVVQLYVKHLGSAVDRPLRQLAGFQRVNLAPREKKTITMDLPAAQLAYWDVAKKSFVVESDQVQVSVGASSADLRLSQTITISR